MTLKLALTAALLACLGCKTIDAAIDCHSICGRYQTCFDQKYDTGACESSCRKKSGADSDYRRQADQCSACIDERSCAGATFTCGLPCSSVVP